MQRRFLSISFPYLVTDWWTIRQPDLKQLPVVITAPSHGRIIITAANRFAENQNIHPGMVLADARAVVPGIHVIDDQPGLTNKLLTKIAEWCIRYSPVTAVQLPDGIVLDITGCDHLWGGEQIYLDTITTRLRMHGYTVQAAIADTIGTAWGTARYSAQNQISENHKQLEALKPLPPQALRLEDETIEKLYKLGLHKIGDFIHFPRRVLSRRFGNVILSRIDQALGNEEEFIEPIKPLEIYSERLPCLDPIITAIGIEIALAKLAEKLCSKLISEQKGLRKAIFSCFRQDNKVEKIEIGTTAPSANHNHIIRLFNEKISTIEPGPGIELFILEAPVVEKLYSQQNKFWQTTGGLKDSRVSELIDRLSARLGPFSIRRYLPDEHYWPERSYKEATSIDETSGSDWIKDKPRPVCLFKDPHPIQVTAPIPDYPPMLFRYNGKLHKISKADGPERIEQEWWIQEGEHRDYYNVEDENGCRYWIFRSGHYEAHKPVEWFLHGLFA